MNSHDITIQFSNCLVVWNMNFMFPIILGRIIPTDYVSEGLKPPTRGIEISGFYENVTVLSLDVIKIYIYIHTYIYTFKYLFAGCFKLKPPRNGYSFVSVTKTWCSMLPPNSWQWRFPEMGIPKSSKITLW